jgi:TRAP transporter 4TM/12TM fusion protein
VSNELATGALNSGLSLRALPRPDFRWLLAFAIGAFCLWNYWYPTVPIEERAIFATLTAPALFLVTRPDTESAFWRYTDHAHAVIGAIVFGYIVVDWEEILLRQGAPTTLDMIFGAMTVYLLLVASTRNMGWGLTVVLLIFLFYTFFGQLLPNWAGGHRGYSLQRTFTFLFLNENGVLGFAIDTCLKYMFLFLLLGKVLEFVGALGFIMDFAKSLFRRNPAGAPMMAVVASGLLGTVTGSSVSNVLVSGTVTIPMMKRVGVSSELAGAIEATASNGSQIMPPVMGFAVFFMIVLLQTTYFEIAMAAIIPGTLYYVSLLFTVWVRTRHLAITSAGSLDENAKPLARVLFSVGAFCFFGTIGALMGFMALRVSAQSAVLYSIGICIVLSWFSRTPFGPRQAVMAIESSGRDLIVISVMCLALGLIVGPILLTGLGTKLPALLTEWSSGQLWLLAIGAFISCVILGTGLPTSTSYVIVALLIGKAMVGFGVPALSAHMFVFYAALAASITPPVAMTAFVAATIAKGEFWRTAWEATFLGIPKYLLPFGFLYRPELLMRAEPLNILSVTAITVAGLFAMSFCNVFWRRGGANRLTAALLAVAGVLMVIPPLSISLLLTTAAVLAVAAAFHAAWFGITRRDGVATERADNG